MCESNRWQIHWPVNFLATPDEGNSTGVALEPSEDGVMLLDRDLTLADTWRALIELQRQGKTRRFVKHNKKSVRTLEVADCIVALVSAISARSTFKS